MEVVAFRYAIWEQRLARRFPCNLAGFPLAAHLLRKTLSRPGDLRTCPQNLAPSKWVLVANVATPASRRRARSNIRRPFWLMAHREARLALRAESVDQAWRREGRSRRIETKASRTRDLRRDGPTWARRRIQRTLLNGFICRDFCLGSGPSTAWLSQTSDRRLGHEWATNPCLFRQRRTLTKRPVSAALRLVRVSPLPEPLPAMPYALLARPPLRRPR
jgi:hypothetical protein